MKYVTSLFGSLMLMWLLLSGHYTMLTTGFGVASCVLVCWLAMRMRLVDAESQPLHVLWQLPGYWLWLAGEILKSNLQVVLLILRGKKAIEPTMVSVPVEQKKPLFQAIFANSITLTPGTVSVRVQGDRIDVHALARTEAKDLQDGEMSRRILKMNQRKPYPGEPGRRS